MEDYLFVKFLYQSISKYIKELTSDQQVKQYGLCNRAGTYRKAGEGSGMLKDTLGG